MSTNDILLLDDICSLITPPISFYYIYVALFDPLSQCVIVKNLLLMSGCSEWRIGIWMQYSMHAAMTPMNLLVEKYMHLFHRNHIWELGILVSSLPCYNFLGTD